MMETKTLNPGSAVEVEAAAAGEEDAVPIVVAKQQAPQAPPAGLGCGAKEENAAETMARLSGWATSSGGEPILAD